jgi:hypothetical protein
MEQEIINNIFGDKKPKKERKPRQPRKSRLNVDGTTTRKRARTTANQPHSYTHSQILEEAWRLTVDALTLNDKYKRFNPSLTGRFKSIFSIPEQLTDLTLFKLNNKNLLLLCKFAVKVKSSNPIFKEYLTKHSKIVIL